MAKKAVFVIGQENVVDQSVAQLAEILRQRGVTIKIASRTRHLVVGQSGQTIEPDLAIPEIKPADFEALIFLCGLEGSGYFNDPTIFQLVHDFRKSGKVIAAFALGPSILANAGVLISKTATAYPSEEKHLISRGAEYTGMPVEVDDKIITAKDRLAIKEFGEKLAYLLGG